MSDQIPSTAELKNQLKNLKVCKGKLSRQIGDHKKNGMDFGDTVEEMKIISTKIKSLENDIKLINKANLKKETFQSPTLFPPHILELPYISEKISSKKYHITEVSNEMEDAWNQYINRHPASNTYHSFYFKNIIEQSFGHKAYYFAAFNENQTIVGIFPVIHTKSKLFGSYMTSVPYFNYGGPLSNNKAIDQQLIQFANRYAIKFGVSHIELRESTERNDLPCKSDKMSLFLTLPDSSEQLWQNIGTKVRAQVKKGLKNKFKFKIGKHELLEDFYRVFSINMRDLGTPVYSKSFFYTILSSPLDAILAVQYHQGMPVSCAFLIAHKNCLEIPWASTLCKANKLDSNMVLYWNILEYACNKGYDFFDFGRSSKDASTFKFKTQWGAEAAQLYWHYLLPDSQALPNLNPNNPKFKFLIWCWKKLPLFIANTFGPLLARSLP